MKAPKLWVWNGSPDDKMDVLRYVSATEDDVLSQPCVEEVCASIQNAWKVKHKADLASRDATIEKLTRCLVKLSLRSSFTEWQEDSPETWEAFNVAMHDGSESDEIDLPALCKALGVEEKP